MIPQRNSNYSSVEALDGYFYERLIDDDNNHVDGRSIRTTAISCPCIPSPVAALQDCLTLPSKAIHSVAKHKTLLLGLAVIAAIGTITGGFHSHVRNVQLKKRHSFDTDYTEIKSSLELRLGSVNHWCLDGSNENCAQCDDPTSPIPRLNSEWNDIFQRNVKLSKRFAMDMNRHPDVIFIGDDNIEARAGTYNGSGGNGSFGKTLAESKMAFEEYFTSAVALGIAGDTSPNLLWRIQHEEFAALRPKVWWINIGHNDLFSTNCSEEITIMGILRIVEELLMRNDDANIVINSLLPVAMQKSMILQELDDRARGSSAGGNVRNMYWYSINRVNHVLQLFAKKHHMVKFFDATAFLTVEDKNRLYMDKDMFVDKMHLSHRGNYHLAKAQADALGHILKKLDKRKDIHDADALGHILKELDEHKDIHDDLLYYHDFVVDDWF